MDSERRYQDEEIKAIFKEAAQAQETAQRNRSHTEGLTLAELQEIGKEAGITPEFIAHATGRLHRSPAPEKTEHFLGLPVRVENAVELERSLSEDEWERLVADLRRTFRAHGKVGRDGSLREWKNGNLRALIEPSDSGHRLRMHTTKGGAKETLTGTLAFAAMGMFMMLVVILGDVTIAKMMAPLLFMAFGLGGAAVSAVRLPAWAAEREEQMEQIASRAIGLSKSGSKTGKVKAQASQAGTKEAEPVQRIQIDDLNADSDDEGRQSESRRTREH